MCIFVLEKHFSNEIYFRKRSIALWDFGCLCFYRFDYYERLKDVQTLALMSCMLAKQHIPSILNEAMPMAEEKVEICFGVYKGWGVTTEALESL